MRVLLDTHALLWFLSGNSRMSDYARRVTADPDNEALLSAGSLWETTIKASLGKLTLDEPFEEVIPDKLAAERIEVLPIEMQYLAALRRLPFHHRDPFDRLIIAQALVEGVPVVTRDAVFESYGVEVIWNEPPKQPAA